MKGNGRILLLLAIVALLYLCFPSRTPECDAVIYASAALRGVREMMFYPGHLGFGPLEAVAAAAGRDAHPPLNPVFLLQYLSMAAALGGAFAFHRTLVDLRVARGRAMAFTGLLVSGYAWWHYALQAESHMISTALLMVFLWRSCRSLAAPSVRSWAGSGLWLGLATLMHQKNLLLAGAALGALALTPTAPGRRLRSAAAFLGVLGLVAVVPYLVVGGAVLGLRTPGELMDWIRGLSLSSAWGHWTHSTPPRAVVGLVRSLVGSHFVLGFEPARVLAARLFPHSSLEDEFAIAAAVQPALRGVLLVLEATVLALAGLALLRWIRRPGVAGASGAPLTAFLLAWTVIAGGFAVWWAPERAEFWMDVFPPVLILLALSRSSAGAPARGSRLAGACALALAVVNLAGSIRPQAQAALEPETAVALALDATVTPGATVLADIPFEGRASRYAEVFTRVDLMAADSPAASSADGARLQFVDSLLAAAAETRRSVYLVVTPLADGGTARAAYRDLVASLGRRYPIGEVVPVRAGIDLRRVRRHPA